MLIQYVFAPLLAAVLVVAVPSPTKVSVPSPTRAFTVRAYESPFTVGQGLTGYYLTAYDGDFFIFKSAPSGGEVKLNVDVHGEASIVSGSLKGAPLFIETVDGQLSYYLPNVGQPPIGPIATNFLHLGSGTEVVGAPGDGSHPPMASFQWLGSSNDYWFACPWGKRPPGEAYRIVKSMPLDGSSLNGCTAVILAAINS